MTHSKTSIAHDLITCVEDSQWDIMTKLNGRMRSVMVCYIGLTRASEHDRHHTDVSMVNNRHYPVKFWLVPRKCFVEQLCLPLADVPNGLTGESE